MVLAHQYLGQLEPKLQEAFAANTAIKFAGGVSAKDARALAAMMYCSPNLIEAQPKGSFAAHVRGETRNAVPLSIPFGFLENLPRMSATERIALRDQMRSHYAEHHSIVGTDPSKSDPEPGIPLPDDGNAGSDPVAIDAPDYRQKKGSGASEPGHIDTSPGDEW